MVSLGLESLLVDGNGKVVCAGEESCLLACALVGTWVEWR